MRTINLIVVHCTATKQGENYTVAEIRKWHVEQRKFRDIGYHFLIHLNGTVEKGRPIEQAGAHAKGFNNNSIGVCYVGGLNKEGKPKDTRTVAQFHALRSCINTLQISFPGANVVGHRDLSVDLNGDGMITENEWMKQCPCFNMSEL